MFIGNKIDLRPNENINEQKYVTFPIASKVVSDLGCKYMECSALTQSGLKSVFDEAIRQVLKKRSGNSGNQQQKANNTTNKRVNNKEQKTADSSAGKCIIM